MHQRPKLLTSQATVRFQDCDPYGHLYNSKYIDYFMNAREDQVLEHYDLDIYRQIKTVGLGWVVVQNQIAYLEPANLMERVRITSKIIQYTKRVLTVELQMLRETSDQLKSMMWTTFVHYNLKTKSSATHSQEYMEMFAEVHFPVPEQQFDQRLAAVKNGLSLK